MGMNKQNGIFLAILLATVIIAVGYGSGLIRFNLGSSNPPVFQTHGKIEVLCDVISTRPVDGLDQPFESSTMSLPATFDLDEGTGAYAGEYAISLNRKGSLRVEGELLSLTRQAMFKRYGLAITGEHVTLNRKTGEFKQWLDLENNKRLDLISGYCKRTDNAPF